MSKLDITIYDLLGEKGDSAYVLVDIKKINEYINLAKALQAEHEALKKDVARYFELRSLPDDKYTTEVSRECVRLELKLWKVGKEE